MIIKRFSVHSDDCPNDCGYNYSLQALTLFDVDISVADKLEIGEILTLENFTVMREE